jgi:hypothetical protein
MNSTTRHIYPCFEGRDFKAPFSGSDIGRYV